MLEGDARVQADSSGAGPREVQPGPARIADHSPGPAALHPERKSHWQISSCWRGQVPQQQDGICTVWGIQRRHLQWDFARCMVSAQVGRSSPMRSMSWGQGEGQSWKCTCTESSTEGSDCVTDTSPIHSWAATSERRKDVHVSFGWIHWSSWIKREFTRSLWLSVDLAAWRKSSRIWSPTSNVIILLTLCCCAITPKDGGLSLGQANVSSHLTLHWLALPYRLSSGILACWLTDNLLETFLHVLLQHTLQTSTER